MLRHSAKRKHYIQKCRGEDNKEKLEKILAGLEKKKNEFMATADKHPSMKAQYAVHGILKCENC